MVIDERSPVTNEDVISRVPMNPIFISEKAKCIDTRSVLPIVDSGRVVGNSYLGISSGLLVIHQLCRMNYQWT
jgi:hypothetical protein